jgi:hypothetical protein
MTKDPDRRSQASADSTETARKPKRTRPPDPQEERRAAEKKYGKKGLHPGARTTGRKMGSRKKYMIKQGLHAGARTGNHCRPKIEWSKIRERQQKSPSRNHEQTGQK